MSLSMFLFGDLRSFCVFVSYEKRVVDWSFFCLYNPLIGWLYSYHVHWLGSIM